MIVLWLSVKGASSKGSGVYKQGWGEVHSWVWVLFLFMFYRAPQLFCAVSLYSAHTESFPSFNHSSRRWMAITTAQTGKLDQSFKPTDYITTAGETSHCTVRVNDECVWKQIFCLFSAFCRSTARRSRDVSRKAMHVTCTIKQRDWRKSSSSDAAAHWS